jgi:hypothetical protein
VIRSPFQTRFFRECGYTTDDVKKRTFNIQDRLKRVTFAKRKMEYSIFAKLENSEYR